MKKAVISLSVSEKGIDKAVQDLKRFEQDILKKANALIEALAKIGLKEASVRFTTAMYDGINDTSVRLDETKTGYSIVADGKAVAFIEFGAGVYHNSAEPYPNPRPEGVAGIGEYGKGYGKRNAWGFKDENDNLIVTRGNPAAMPMWYASEEIKHSVLKVVKEVFA